MSYRVTLTLHNLNFTIKVHDNKLYSMLDGVMNQLVTYSLVYNKYLKRLTRTIDKSYYTRDPKTDEYRFPIKVISNVMRHMGTYGIVKEDIQVINETNPDLELVDFNLNKKYILRDYQEDYVGAVMTNLNKKIFLIDAPTGSGKGLMSSAIISKLRYRVGVMLLPKFINKWVLDAKNYLGVEDEDIYVVQGIDSLYSLVHERDITYKIIIFSLTTMTYYLSDYEKLEQVPIAPSKLFEHLKIGVMFNDETHLSFAALTRCMLYFNPIYFIGSSATLDSNQKDLRRMYNIVIPPENRVSNLLQVDPYVNVKAVSYQLQFNKRIKYKRSQGYNHILYEQSIMKNSIFRNNYFDMIVYYLEDMFFKKREDKKKDKVAIFIASVDMCSLFTNYLKKKYPHENIYRYVGGDSYQTMLESNIIISNNGMLGTAVDIPNLITVIQTISTSSLQINIQNFGRLRKIKDRQVWYCYLYTRDIPRQYPMHMDRYNAIKDKIKEYYSELYPKLIKTV